MDRRIEQIHEAFRSGYFTSPERDRLIKVARNLNKMRKARNKRRKAGNRNSRMHKR